MGVVIVVVSVTLFWTLLEVHPIITCSKNVRKEKRISLVTASLVMDIQSDKWDGEMCY